MAGTPLAGYSGKLAQVASSSVTTGTLTENVKYIAKVIDDSSSALPIGVEVGKAFVADGTEDITSTDDEVIALTESDKCDVTSWSIDLSKSEIDVTTLCDEVSIFITGRPDLSGSIEGIFKQGVTDVDDGVLNAFVDIVSQAGAGGAVTVNDQANGQFIFLLYKQKDTAAGSIEQCYVAPVVITSYSDSASGSDAQSFSSSFRITSNDDVDFHLLSVTHS
jgi:hypothetical protein